ncbi:glycosyltransferase [Kineococcus sp. R8]|nr:glycosyltransferase [Kineococcus siccus]
MVTESFLPQVNGVTRSVQRVCEHLARRGHEAVVVAPGRGPRTCGPYRVVRIPSVPLPGHAAQRVAYPTPVLAQALGSFRPDVVHLAAPTVLGAQAATLARRAGVPAVAIYQTDLPGFVEQYGLGGVSTTLWRWLRRVHGMAARTLAPSRQACAQLRSHGVPDVSRWPRGVDLERFSPLHRDDDLRRRLAPRGEVLVGYVGRLAREKELHLLTAVDALPGVRLVVVGDGPQRPQLQRLLPRAEFLGMLHGQELSAAYASLDLFVHTGRHETFCQSAQEALASSVPVVAPAAGGLLDLVVPGVNGSMFAPGAAADLQAEVARLAQDAQARQELAFAARPSVQHRDWFSIGEQLVATYDELVG